MEKIHQPGIHLNRSRCGKALLAMGLLLVFVLGLSQVYEVQNFFFPGRYQEQKLHLIEGECLKVKKELTSFRAEIDKLKTLRENRAQLPAAPPGRKLSLSPSSQAAASVRLTPELPWQSTLQTAKKARVYVARKLPLIDTQLKSLQRSLELQGADIGAASPAKSEIDQTLQRVQENRACWQAYHDRLDELSDQLNKLVRETQVNE
ncbi:MAG: hypothetical protein WBV23_15080 [Desulfobaccales bacterium]